MALLAETLVEEWLNRDGYFTIRGLRTGNDEIDLLAIRQTDVAVEGLHVEAQVSFRPISYVTQLPTGLARALNTARRSAKKRSPDVLRQSVDAFIKGKYRSPAKTARREKLWPGIDWQLLFVHGVVKYDEELRLIERAGVRLVSFETVLHDLCPAQRSGYTSASGDLADILDFYVQRRLAQGNQL